MKITFIIFLILMLALPLNAQEYSLKKAVFGTGGGVIESEQAIVRLTLGQTLTHKQIHENINVLWGFWISDHVATDAETENLAPQFIFELKQNFPNPFNPVTTIRYSVGGHSQTFINIKIFDVKGALVRTLVNEYKAPGVYHALWDGKNESGHSVSSGIYFYRLQGDTVMKTKKLVLLR